MQERIPYYSIHGAAGTHTYTHIMVFFDISLSIMSRFTPYYPPKWPIQYHKMQGFPRWTVEFPYVLQISYFFYTPDSERKVLRSRKDMLWYASYHSQNCGMCFCPGKEVIKFDLQYVMNSCNVHLVWTENDASKRQKNIQKPRSQMPGTALVVMHWQCWLNSATTCTFSACNME